MNKYKPERIPMLIHIRAEIKRSFKAWCIMHDVSMTTKLEELMQETVRKDLKAWKKQDDG